MLAIIAMLSDIPLYISALFDNIKDLLGITY